MKRILAKSELEKIDRCVRAAIEGSFFEGDLFHTLIGLTQEEAHMERQLQSGESWELLVNNGLLNLVGYPHRKPDELFARTMLTREQIRELLARFREATGRAPTRRHFEGFE